MFDISTAISLVEDVASIGSKILTVTGAGDISKIIAAAAQLGTEVAGSVKDATTILTSEDQGALDAALENLQRSNDDLHTRLTAQLDAASKLAD